LFLFLFGGSKIRRNLFRIILRRLDLHWLLKWQPANSHDEERMSIYAENMPFEQLVAIINQKTNFTIIYDKWIMKEARPVTISRKDATVNEILVAALSFQRKGYYCFTNGKLIFLIWIPKKWRERG